MELLKRFSLWCLPASAVVLSMLIAGSVRAGMLSDFEDGTLQGWTVDAGTSNTTLTIDNTTASEGTYSARINVSDGGFKFGAMRYDQGAVNPHHPEWVAGTKLLFDVKAGTFTDFMTIRPSYIPSYNGGANDGGTSDGPDISIHLIPNVWQTVEWVYPQPPASTAPAQNEPPNFWIEWFSVNSNGPMELWVDNIRIVPEPASLALWSLGGLGLMLLRKKRS